MKVLGIVSSARKLGNSEILAKEILLALPEDTEKKLIRLPELSIHPCTACYACLPTEKNCVIRDDLSFLLDQIREADAVVIAAPCYFLGTHTAVKIVNDRLISVLNNAAEFSGKKCVIAVSYGIEGWEGFAREATNNFARFLHLDVVGTMLVKAASPGEVVRPEVMAETRRLANALQGIPAPGTDRNELLSCAECGSSLLQITSDGGVFCRMCGLTGKLAMEHGKTSIHFAQGAHRRFSVDGMTEHGRLLEGVRDDYIARRQELNKLRKPYQAYDWWIKPSQ